MRHDPLSAPGDEEAAKFVNGILDKILATEARLDRKRQMARGKDREG